MAPSGITRGLRFSDGEWKRSIAAPTCGRHPMRERPET